MRLGPVGQRVGAAMPSIRTVRPVVATTTRTVPDHALVKLVTGMTRFVTLRVVFSEIVFSSRLPA